MGMLLGMRGNARLDGRDVCRGKCSRGTEEFGVRFPCRNHCVKSSAKKLRETRHCLGLWLRPTFSDMQDAA